MSNLYFAPVALILSNLIRNQVGLEDFVLDLCQTRLFCVLCRISVEREDVVSKL